MRSLSQKIIFILLLCISAFAQSPHGDDFDFDCELCHKSDDWKVDLNKVQFDHSTTKFELIGQHKSADCRSCTLLLNFLKLNQIAFPATQICTRERLEKIVPNAIHQKPGWLKI